MIPDNDVPEGLYKKEDIKMLLDKIPELEKKVERLENELTQLKISNKAHHNRMYKVLERIDDKV